MEDDEKLPVIFLTSPKNPKNTFYMPDASVLVSQRKEDIELDEVIEAYRRRFITDEIESNDNQSSDSEISTFLGDLKLDKRNNFIKSENPGIDLREVDIPILCDCLKGDENQFAVSTLTRFKKLDDENLRTAILLLTDMVQRCINEASTLQYDTILCLLIILCTIVLEKKFRAVADIHQIRDIIQQMMRDFCALHQVLASTVAQELWLRFKHFHDRLYLVENIFIVEKVPLKLLNTELTYFASQVAQCLTVATLCELIGNDSYGVCHLPQTVFDVKKILLSGEKRKSLATYEQYCVLKFLNILFDFLPDSYDSVTERIDAAKAKRQIIAIVSSWNRKQGSSSGDVHQMKVITARTKLLWEDNIKGCLQDDIKD